MTRHVSRATDSLDNPGWLKLLARTGFGAKGVVYLIIGVAAIGGAGAGPHGALGDILRQPFGRVMLGALALGLLAYAAWRTVQSVLDPEREGNDATSIGKRIGWFCSGLVYAALAYSAARLALGGDRSGGSGAEGGTATLLGLPFGRYLVAIVGIGILLAGVHQARQTLTAGFHDEFALDSMSETERTWATRAGRVGHAARALLYAIIGGLLLKAAWTRSADEAGGIGEALDLLRAQPYGPLMLTLAGAGLVCYGLYCFVMARYRKAVRL